MCSTLPKQFIEINGKPILMHTILAFNMCDTITLVLPEHEIEVWEQLCQFHNFKVKHNIVIGGETRFQSVKNGLEIVDNNSIVAIHDGVRPFVTRKIISNSLRVAKEKGNAIVCVDSKDSLREITGSSNKHVDRSKFKIIQTPQTFQSTLIKKAYEQEEKVFFTDDASVLEATGENINLIDGDYRNIKITTPEDLIVAEAYLKNSKEPIN